MSPLCAPAAFTSAERLWPAGFTAEWADEKGVRFINSITETPSGPVFRCAGCCEAGDAAAAAPGLSCQTGCRSCWLCPAFAEPLLLCACLPGCRVKAQRLAHDTKPATEIVELGAGPTPDAAYKVRPPGCLASRCSLVQTRRGVSCL